VSWPQAAHRAQTVLTARANAAKGNLARRAEAAKTYTAAYAGNLGTATGALPALHAAATVVSALGNRSGTQKQPAPTYLAAEVAKVTPQPAGRQPEFTGTDLAATARGRGSRPQPPVLSTSLPPATLPPPTPWAQRLRDRLGGSR
jgi:hypothetical protein